MTPERVSISSRMRIAVLTLLPGFILVATMPSVLAEEAQQPVTAKAEKSVDFAHEIVPILQKRCTKCHAGTQRKGGYSINTRQTVVAGGDEGPAVIPRKSVESALIERVSSDDPGLRMPPEGERLTAEQIGLLARWIDLNLPWDDGFAFGKISRQAPLAPRRPAVPTLNDGDKWPHPVDRFLDRYFAERKVVPEETVSDTVYARRASFDLIGLGPTSVELDEFVADTRSDKREQLINHLLADNRNYAAHWLTFWNDLLRNAYHGTGFIDGGRKQITGWLYGALYDNKPYDQFVRELVSPAEGSGCEGFIYGIKWRGTVNESQRREVQAAQSVAQVFLGTNLKCASCHDSFVNHWKLTDAYALASVFADKPLELHRCDQPIGVPSTVGFLYPQLGPIDGQASEAHRRRQLADLLTHPENGRLARTIVNRLWARLFGRGLIEPLDNMDAESWHQDLLDFLATDLADHGYDLKHTLRLLATSRAYQLAGTGGERVSTAEAVVFRGPLVKRVTAEEFVDAVFALTNGWPECDTGMLRRDGRGQYGQLGDLLPVLAAAAPQASDAVLKSLASAKWVWLGSDDPASTMPRKVYLRKAWTLDDRPARATATFAASDSCELFINGKSVAKSTDWKSPLRVDVSNALVKGVNIIAINASMGENASDPAGVIGDVFTIGANGRPSVRLSTNSEWQVSETAADDWLKPEFDASDWKSAAERGDVSTAPWNLAQLIAAGKTGLRNHVELPLDFRIRAALMPLDGLQSALGRPNREQVVSARDSVPTMLQALELTNGAALGKVLAHGAEYWHHQNLASTAELVDRLYGIALTRRPSDEERRLALELLGLSTDVESIEDFLWTICMLPEFQLVP